MKNPTVYLAGPIFGLSFFEANEWRTTVQTRLSAFGIDAYSPLRDKLHLTDEEFLKKEYTSDILSTQKSITVRDRHDATNCGVLMVNLLESRRVSIGTMIEVGWADSRNIPVVLIMEKDGSNVHDHPMLKELSSFWVDTVEDAIKITVSLLTPSGNS